MNQRESIFQKALKSQNVFAIEEVAGIFRGMGEYEKAAALNAHIRELSNFNVGFGSDSTPPVNYSAIQSKLNEKGANPPLKVDGEWGPKSKAALIAYQSSHGLKPDGIPGPLTLASLGLTGSPDNQPTKPAGKVIGQFLDYPGLRDRMKKEPKFGPEFLAMCQRLNLDPNNILSVMSVETAGTFDPAIQNPSNPDPDQRATGLIQFMPSTARILGTSIPELRKMTAVEQLKYVEKFFQLHAGRIRKDVPGDYYMAVFMPAFIGQDSSFVLGRKDDPGTIAGISLAKVYNQNSGFDREKKGYITVGDVWNTTLSRIASAKLRAPIDVTLAAAINGGAIVLTILAIGTFLLRKKLGLA